MFGKNEKIGAKYFSNMKEDELTVTSVFYTLQGEGPYSGMPAVFVRLSKCQLSCSFCFSGDTEIKMGDGTSKRIDNIEIGDEVVSWKDGKWEIKRVTETFERTVDEILKIEAGSKRYYVTKEHPFMVKDKGWVNAEDLEEGDVLIHFSSSDRMKLFNPMFGKDTETRVGEAQKGKEGYETPFLSFNQKTPDSEIYQKVSDFISNGLVVKSITKYENTGDGKGPDGKAWDRLAGGKGKSVSVYNFEVEDNHTYVANSALVHNCDTYFDSGDVLTFDELDEKIRNVLPEEKWKETVLVITGGEPGLQQNIVSYLNRNAHKWKNTQIESNGLLEFKGLSSDVTLVISPKCIEKNGVAIKYMNVHRQNMHRANFLKFVMNADPESPYSEVPQWAFDWKNEFPNSWREIYVSPMNIYNEEPKKAKELRNEKGEIDLETRSDVEEVISFWEPGLLNLEENELNHRYVAEYCMKHNLRMQVQLHLYAGLA